MAPELYATDEYRIKKLKNHCEEDFCGQIRMENAWMLMRYQVWAIPF